MKIDADILKDCGVFFINEHTSIVYSVIETAGTLPEYI